MGAGLGAAREQCREVDGAPGPATESGRNFRGDAQAVDGNDGVAGAVGVIEGFHDGALGFVDVATCDTAAGP